MSVRDEIIKATIEKTDELAAQQTDFCRKYAVLAAGYKALVKLLAEPVATPPKNEG